MAVHIRPKHQKLILHCYPPGKQADKRPNPSELSYLLYYATTRRAKLTKVGIFLETKTAGDVYKSRTGDVQVTLSILKALIKETHEDLNLFAVNVVNIILTVLSSNDLALCRYAHETLETFCEYHDGALFSGDPFYVEQFHKLVEEYISLAKYNQSKSTPTWITTDPTNNSAESNNTFKNTTDLEWRLVGTKALKSFASSAAISTPTGLSHLYKIIPVLLSTLSAADPDGSKIVKLDNQKGSTVTHDVEKGNSGDRSLRASTESYNKNYDEFTELPEYSLLLSTSLGALKSFYDTTSDMILKASIVTTLAFIRDNSPSTSSLFNQWASTLLITCAKWVPAQLRFAVISTTIEKLNSCPIDNLLAQFTFASLISSLLSSSVNMIGLSVIDTQRSFLHQQSVLLKSIAAASATNKNSNIKELYHIGSPSVYDLVEKLRECVVKLTTHVYYATQIPDMLSELLLKFQESMQHHPASTVAATTNTSAHDTETTTLSGRSSETSVLSPNSYSHTLYISNLLKTITEILSKLSLQAKHTGNGGANVPLTISSWDGTQKLLTHIDPEVRIAFANTLIVFINSNNDIDPDRIAPLSSSVNFTMLSGPVGRIIGELYNLANASEFPLLVSDYLIIYHVAVTLSSKLSMNGALRSAALAYSLQEKAKALLENAEKETLSDNTSSLLSHAIALATTSLSIFHTIGETLDSADFSNFTKQEILRRQKLGLWYPVFDFPLDNDVDFSKDVVAKSELVKKDPYTVPSEWNEELSKSQYPSEDDVMELFNRFDQVPKEMVNSVVQELPLTNEASGLYSSVAGSRQSSIDDSFANGLGSKGARSMMMGLPRARSLRDLNMNLASTARSTSAFHVQSTVPETYMNTGFGNREERDTGDFSSNFSLKGDSVEGISSNGNSKTDRNPVVLLVNEENGNTTTHSNSNIRLGLLPGGDYSNSTSSFLNPYYSSVNSSCINTGSTNNNIGLRTAQSFIDIHREHTPKVKDLKKAASGYRLPYAMGATSMGNSNAGSIASFANSSSAALTPQSKEFLSGNHDGNEQSAGNGLTTDEVKYARSINSAFTRGSGDGPNSPYSDSASLEDQATRKPNNLSVPFASLSPSSKSLVPNSNNGSSFDVASFLNDLSFENDNGRGRFV